MPNSDYVSSGGGLKLKGVKDAGIKKSKKKKDKNNSVTTTNESVASQEKNAPQGHIDEDDTAEIATEKQPTTKTEAERKYDEMRRKRVGRTGIPLQPDTQLTSPPAGG